MEEKMFVAGTGLFAVFSVMGFLFSPDTSIIYSCCICSTDDCNVNFKFTGDRNGALSGPEGRQRVDGSTIFNTLRQISSSPASTLAVLIYTLMGSSMTAIHGVYVYFGLITIAVAAAVILYLKAENKTSGNTTNS